MDEFPHSLGYVQQESGAMKILFILVMCGWLSLPVYGKSVDSCAFNKNALWDGLVTYHGPSNKMARINDVITKGGLYFDNALTVAVWFGYDNIIIKLLNNHNIRDKYGPQSLYVAASMGRLTEMSMLLDSGVSVNSQVHYGGGGYATPIYGAAQSGCVAAMQLLVKHGADVNYRGGTRLTLLELAIGGDHLSAGRYLLTHGYKVSEAEKVRVNKILVNLGMIPGLRPIFWRIDRSDKRGEGN
ncbi:MAG: ankyrin repeat domain-containing protein [Ktedonobacteraceae bacterium]